LRTRRCNEEGWRPTTPGNRCEKNLSVSLRNERSLDAPQLLQEREGDDLGVRESLEGLVAVPLRVEEAVGVVYEAEQDG